MHLSLAAWTFSVVMSRLSFQKSSKLSRSELIIHSSSDSLAIPNQPSDAVSHQSILDFMTAVAVCYRIAKLSGWNMTRPVRREDIPEKGEFLSSVYVSFYSLFSRYFIPVCFAMNVCFYPRLHWLCFLCRRLTNIYCNLSMLIIHKVTRNLLYFVSRARKQTRREGYSQEFLFHSYLYRN